MSVTYDSAVSQIAAALARAKSERTARSDALTAAQSSGDAAAYAAARAQLAVADGLVRAATRAQMLIRGAA